MTKINLYKQRPRPDQHLVMQPQIIILPSGWTEYHYFKEFESQLVSIRVKPPVPNLEKLNQKAIEILKTQKERRPNDSIDDAVWIVIDRDYQPGNRKQDALFHKIVIEAENQGIQVAYSDDAFELWFLLHYEEVNQSMSAKELVKKLQTHCPDYKKPARYMYQRLSQRNATNQAIRRAASILKRAEKTRNKNQTVNPSTTVHLLVDKIL